MINKPEIKITIKSGYMGGINARALIDGKYYFLDLENLENVIKNQIKERGFTTNREGRQVYDRLKINN
ncbi:MAG: hypothetical protein WC917_00030 [Bacilli bacterium]|jgi:hypothetical protein